MSAFIHDRPVDTEEAIEAAAQLLRNSHHPLIAGLGTDTTGARTAFRLAARLRGVVDHSASDVLLKDVRAVQDAGAMFAMPTEARLRADVLLGVGPGSLLPERLEITSTVPPRTRELIWLCPPGDIPAIGADHLPPVLRIGDDPAELPTLIALLRARVNGRRALIDGAGRAVDGIVERLQSARFGFAAFDPADLDSLTIENLYGLVRDLNARTRFSVVRHAGPDNVNGVNEVSIWMAGSPVRVGFGRGFPEHDPWRFEARRLVENGEVDAALWISTIEPTLPGWAGRIPTIAILGPGGARAPSEVVIDVGAPAVDHDAVLFSPQTGVLMNIPAASVSNRSTANQVLAGIEARLSMGSDRC